MTAASSRRILFALLASLGAIMGAASASAASCYGPAGDIDQSGSTKVLDVQCGILIVLWKLGDQNEASPACAGGEPGRADVVCDGELNVSDVQVVVLLALAAPLGALDANNDGCIDVCEFPECGDGLCDPGESCSECDVDCGYCPSTLEFSADWSEAPDGLFVGGDEVRIVYDLDRLPTCRANKAGLPAWQARLRYRFSASGPVHVTPLSEFLPATGQVEAIEPIIAIPDGTADVWFSVEVEDVMGCLEVDDYLGSGYRFPVFSPEVAMQPIGWAGDVQFVQQDGSEFHFLGDDNPVWSIGQWMDQGQGSWLQVSVWVPGITDRSYSSASVAFAIAETAINARAAFARIHDPQLGALGAWQQAPMEYVGTSNGSFVYRWVAGMLALEPGIEDGAYEYVLALSTAWGPVTEVAGEEGSPRVILIGATANCEAFLPYSPPELCN